MRTVRPFVAICCQSAADTTNNILAPFGAPLLAMDWAAPFLSDDSSKEGDALLRGAREGALDAAPGNESVPTRAPLS